LYPILLHRDGARAVTYGGPTEIPPPHTQANLGVGGQLMRKRTRAARQYPGGEVGGEDPSHHRSRDTSFIGGEMRTLGLIGPMLGKGSK